jgi:uncharacterized protein YecE (DUF72 family)
VSTNPKDGGAGVHIGTSGFHYKHWIGPFYPPRTPASKMLAYYYEHFDTVELNNTFYRLPTKNALENWRDSTPEKFCFAAKGSRFLTHMKKLKDPQQGLGRFFDAVDVLRQKLGPILFQLPPNWELDLDRFTGFLKALPRYHRYAFEFRNPTWNTPKIYDQLSLHRAGYCIFDLAGFQSPIEVTTDLVYIRLHGPGGKYQGSYNDAALSNWADRIRQWHHERRSVCVYFDNDQAGYAARNALKLKALLAVH